MQWKVNVNVFTFACVLDTFKSAPVRYFFCLWHECFNKYNYWAFKSNITRLEGKQSMNQKPLDREIAEMKSIIFFPILKLCYIQLLYTSALKIVVLPCCQNIPANDKGIKLQRKFTFVVTYFDFISGHGVISVGHNVLR